MSSFQKFTSIESFAHVFRGQDFYDTKAVVQYGAKIKLHGTNAAVRVTSGGAVPAEVVAQSRSRDITPENDNAGFAKWVKENEEAWFTTTAGGAPDIIFFGEWAGKGIQKNDAVTKLDQKYFFVFAVQVEDRMITTPADIEDIIPDLDDVVVLPWDMIFETEVDYNDPDACQTFADLLNEKVKEVGERDPFIYGIFGVDGPGEGWVVSPVCNPGEDPLDGNLDVYWYNVLAFKVKTEAHMVQKTKKAASKDIEVPEGVPEFVEMFVTPARCEQGVTEACNGEAMPENTGHFLKWIGQDIKKESVQELADAGLEWKDVSRHVTQAARQWYLDKTQEIV